MKVIKYITAAVLIAITFVLIGEIYVWHIDSFESEYSYVTFYLQDESKQDEMLNDIKDAAMNNQVEVFVKDQVINSLFSETINIYATQGAEKNLKSNSDIMSGKYKSIFLGEVEVEIKQFEDIPDISLINTYYLIGENDNFIKFKQSLINKYAGKFPQPATDFNSDIIIIIAVWTVVAIFLLLQTLYEIAIVKKETMIRIILGEKPSQFIAKRIIIDLIVYCILFSSIFLIFKNITYTHYCIYISIIWIAVFLLINSLLYLKLFITNYKKDIGSKDDAKNILNASYVFKIITIIITVAVMSLNMEFIHKGIDFYRQSNFFEEHDDYNYLTVNGDDMDETLSANLSLYEKMLESDMTISLVNLGKWESSLEYIMGDRGAVKYLKNEIPELTNKDLLEKVYFFMPEETSSKNQAINETIDIWESYYHGEYDYEIISYKDDVDILSIENIGKIKSTFIDNPIIILNNMDKKSLKQYWNIGYIANSTMYKITDNEWNEFIEEVDLKDNIHYKTNVYDNFEYQWEIVKRNLYTGVVFLVLMILLEIIVIFQILSYDYKVNAIILAIKKIFGYSLYDRNKKIFILTIIFSLISCISCVILFSIFQLSKLIPYIILGTLIILVIEIIIIIIKIKKQEKQNLIKTLKGGQNL